MLFEVYATKKRAPQAGVPAMPMEETLQTLKTLQAVPSTKKNLTQKDNAFAPAINLISATTKAFTESIRSKPEVKEELKRRVDIV